MPHTSIAVCDAENNGWSSQPPPYCPTCQALAHTRGYSLTLLPLCLAAFDSVDSAAIATRLSATVRCCNCAEGCTASGCYWVRKTSNKQGEAAAAAAVTPNAAVTGQAMSNCIDDGIDEGRHNTTERVLAGAIARVIQAVLQLQLHVNWNGNTEMRLRAVSHLAVRFRAVGQH